MSNCNFIFPKKGLVQRGDYIKRNFESAEARAKKARGDKLTRGWTLVAVYLVGTRISSHPGYIFRRRKFL